MKTDEKAGSKRAAAAAAPDLPDVLASLQNPDVFARVQFGMLRLGEIAMKVRAVELLWRYAWKRRPPTDADMSAILGRSAKTIARARAELRRWDKSVLAGGQIRPPKGQIRPGPEAAAGRNRPPAPAQSAEQEGPAAAVEGASGRNLEERSTEKKQRGSRLPLPDWFDEVLAQEENLRALDPWAVDVVSTLARARERGATEKQLAVLEGAREKLRRGRKKGYSILAPEDQRAFSEDYQRRVRERGLG